MISKIDIYRTAKITIDKCEGHYDPKEYATFRSAQLHQEGDIEGSALWLEIANAIGELLEKEFKGKLN